MSIQFRGADPAKHRPSRSKDKVKMPPPPTEVTMSRLRDQFQRAPCESNVGTMPDYGMSQANARPELNMPMRAPDPQRYQTPFAGQGQSLQPPISPPAYTGFVSPGAQPQSSHALENELRNMILSLPSRGTIATGESKAAKSGSKEAASSADAVAAATNANGGSYG